LLKALLRTMRPKQWTKNGLLFLAMIFTINQYWRLFSAEMYWMLGQVLAAFCVFCLFSSAVYILNDLVDIEKDRNHPVKRHRPLPAGLLPVPVAIVALVVILLVALVGAFLLSPAFGLIGLIYFIIQVSYSFVLKNLVIVDVLTIAVGFVLRAVAGAAVIAVPISPWLYVCTLLGALFLGLSKRRHELVLLNAEAVAHRAILKEYTPQFLDQMIAVVVSTTVMAYSLYTFSAENLPKNHAMMLTIPFVIYGAFRYLYLIYLKDEGGTPEEVLIRDLPIIVDILLWMATVLLILYFFR